MVPSRSLPMRVPVEKAGCKGMFRSTVAGHSGESRILGQGMLLKKFHTQFRKSTFQFGNKVVIRFKIMD